MEVCIYCKKRLSHYTESEFVRPLLPHTNYDLESAKDSVIFLKDLDILKNALLIGISLGGLVAAKLQEEERSDVFVICISSPTRFKDITLEKNMLNRVVFYSSKDEVIADRVSDWQKYAEAHDLPWLDHDTDKHIPKLVELIKAYCDRQLQSTK